MISNLRKISPLVCSLLSLGSASLESPLRTLSSGRYGKKVESGYITCDTNHRSLGHILPISWSDATHMRTPRKLSGRIWTTSSPVSECYHYLGCLHSFNPSQKRDGL